MPVGESHVQLTTPYFSFLRSSFPGLLPGNACCTSAVVSSPHGPSPWASMAGVDQSIVRLTSAPIYVVFITYPSTPRAASLCHCGGDDRGHPFDEWRHQILT